MITNGNSRARKMGSLTPRSSTQRRRRMSTHIDFHMRIRSQFPTIWSQMPKLTTMVTSEKIGKSNETILKHRELLALSEEFTLLKEIG